MFRQEKKYYFSAFLLAFLIATITLLPFVIYDGGYFVFHGDYNAQQIPFYKLCVEQVHSGDLGWNWTTDLGVNFIGSYSFYTLGSPFFWIACLFPSSVSHYLMAPLLVLKIALSSLFAFAYIRRFVKKPQSAVIGGLLYAFSAYSLYNLVFNHFHEVICFFPLLLIGLEEAVVNKRRGVFALAVALMALVNYYFFFTEVIFLIFYFIIRCAMSKEFRISFKDFLCLGVESIAGVMIACVLFVPSAMSVLGLDRVGNIVSGFDFLINKNPFSVGNFLESLFSAETVANDAVLFTNQENFWNSMAPYLPMFSISGVIAFYKLEKKSWIKVLIAFSLLFALIPGFNAAFGLLNVDNYCRWFIMPVLVMCVATVRVLEEPESDFRMGAKATAIMTILVFAIPNLVPVKMNKDTVNELGEKVTEQVIVPKIVMYGLNTFQITMIVLTAAMVVLLLILSVSHKKLNTDAFLEKATTFVLVAILAINYTNITASRSQGPLAGQNAVFVNAELDLGDYRDDFYRLITAYPIMNYHMLWDTPSQQTFHSVVPNNICELYETINGYRKVYSGRPYSDYAYNALTNTRYFLLDKQSVNILMLLGNIEETLKTFEMVDEQGNFYIYKNKTALPMGYAYDSYVLKEDLDVIDIETSDESGDKSYANSISHIMIRSVVLERSPAEKYSELLSYLPSEEIEDRTYETFLEDYEARSALAVDEFLADGSDVTVKTSYDEERVVVLSMAYDKGWSAEIDGEPLELDVMNYGYMGMVVPAGEHTITMHYTTPGLKVGIIISIAGVLVYAVYMLVIRFVLKDKARVGYHAYLLEGQPVGLHNSYIERMSRLSDGLCEHISEESADNSQE